MKPIEQKFDYEQMQEEIRKLVYAQYAQTLNVRNQENDLEATLEALKEVTQLPESEIRSIAEQVKQKYQTSTQTRFETPADIADFDYLKFITEPQHHNLVRSNSAFNVHLTIFGIVNTFFLLLNLLTHGPFPWFMFPLFGWSIAIAIHYLVGKRTPQKIIKTRIETLARLSYDVIHENFETPSHTLWSAILRCSLNNGSQAELAQLIKLQTNCEASKAEIVAKQLLQHK
jgi:ribosomal protein S13